MRGATYIIYYWRLLLYFHLTYQKTIPKIFVLHEMFRCLNSFRGGIGSHSVARGSSSPCFVNLSCVKVGLVFSSSDRFLFCWAAFLSISLCLSCLSFSSSSHFAWFMRECLTGAVLLCMDTLSCIHGVGRWHWYSRPAAWSCVPVQS